jgi:catechol 2,3-dioxygenase-like lactoylglutathione lyase family enzyme
MLDHVGFAVADAERSRRFYEQALAPLGITLIMSVTPEQTEAGGTAHGFGSNGKPYFWIGDRGPGANDPESFAAMPGGHGGLDTRAGQGTHVAFAAETRAVVDAFHEAALAAGGRDNGAPGLRPHYHPNYYGAFVLDPDGMNIEAVCHKDVEHDREAHLHHRL